VLGRPPDSSECAILSDGHGSIAADEVIE